MNELLFQIKKELGGGYTAKSVEESIFTEAETIKELKLNVKEAVACHCESSRFLDVRIVYEQYD